MCKNVLHSSQKEIHVLFESGMDVSQGVRWPTLRVPGR